MLIKRNIDFVFAQRLCVGCGACAGICPKSCITLGLNLEYGLIEPKVDAEKCTKCALCVQVCPGWHYDLGSLLPFNHSKIVPNLGGTERAFVGCSLEDRVRVTGASGGMVSEVLVYLMEKGLIDGAIVSRMKRSAPLEAETIVARNPYEIFIAQGSKYCPVATCLILREVLEVDGKYAFVGLPCQVAALRKAQIQNPTIIERVPYVLGLFCSRTPNALATKYLLHTLHIEPDEVQSIRYRGDGHPGTLRLKLNDGSTKLVDHLNPLYWGFTFQNFFKPVRCWLCLDHSAELAHWSFGDNWVRGLLDKQDNKGASLIVARNAEAADILEYMRKENRVKLQAVTPEMIVVQQALVEKSNVAPRLWIWGKTRHMGPELGSSADRPTQPVEILTALIEYLRILLSHKWRSYWVLDISIGFFRLLHLSFRGIHKSWSGFRRLLSTLRIFSLAKDKPLSKSHMHKIMMIGGFGYRDIGDEAMPHADVINFRERLDDLDIVMCSPDPDYTLAFHGERAIPDITNLSCSHKTSFRRKLKVLFFRYVFLAGAVAERLGVHLRLWPTARTVLDELASADLLFNVGGGNLNSVIPTELYKKCTMHLAARILKKPVILSGQTIGPFDRTIDKLWARICLNRVNMITFRDEAISHKRLLEIGVSKPIMLDTADDAMTLPTLSRRESNFLLYSCVPKSWWMQKAALCIAMNFKGSLMLFKGNDRCDSLSNEVKLMARIADQLIEAYDAKIFFLPTDYHRAADDRVLHREIIALMKYVKRAALVENEYDDIRLKGLISIADAAIGVRYHFCVFAASCFVPFLGMASGVYQRTKLKGLADLCELPNCFVSEDLEFTTCEKVWPQVKEFIENRELSVQVLEMKIPMLKERSLIGVENAWKILRAM